MFFLKNHSIVFIGIKFFSSKFLGCLKGTKKKKRSETFPSFFPTKQILITMETMNNVFKIIYNFQLSWKQVAFLIFSINLFIVKSLSHFILPS